MNCYKSMLITDLNPKITVTIDQSSEDSQYTYHTQGQFDIVPSKDIYTNFTRRELQCRLQQTVASKVENQTEEYYFDPLSFIYKPRPCSRGIGLAGYIASKVLPETNAVTTTIVRKFDQQTTINNYSGVDVHYTWDKFYGFNGWIFYPSLNNEEPYFISSDWYYRDHAIRNLLPIGGFYPSYPSIVDPNTGQLVPGAYPLFLIWDKYPHTLFSNIHELGTCDLEGNSPFERITRNSSEGTYKFKVWDTWFDLYVYDGETASNNGVTVTIQLF
jgi:hypothetical protein